MKDIKIDIAFEKDINDFLKGKPTGHLDHNMDPICYGDTIVFHFKKGVSFFKGKMISCIPFSDIIDDSYEQEVKYQITLEGAGFFINYPTGININFVNKIGDIKYFIKKS
jgi:hypothetical protein